jgi:hypothetical protein
MPVNYAQIVVVFGSREYRSVWEVRDDGEFAGDFLYVLPHKGKELVAEIEEKRVSG